MRVSLSIEGETHSVALLRHDGGGRVWIDGNVHEASIALTSTGEHVVTIDGVPHRLWIAQHGDTAWVHGFGRSWEVSLADPVRQAGAGRDATDAALAPMPGSVMEVLVQAGDTVEKGQTMLVIESMKMQTSITAGRDGTVAEVAVAKGQSFNRGTLLARLKAGEG